LSVKLIQHLKNRIIVLFPDSSTNGIAYEFWKNICNELILEGFNCSISDYLEINASHEEKEQGCDLADYVVKFPISEFLNDQQKIETLESHTLKLMIEANPAITNLINRFNLDQE